MSDYKMPDVLDSPPEIYPIILEDSDPTHPVTGATGALVVTHRHSTEKSGTKASS